MHIRGTCFLKSSKIVLPAPISLGIHEKQPHVKFGAIMTMIKHNSGFAAYIHMYDIHMYDDFQKNGYYPSFLQLSE